MWFQLVETGPVAEIRSWVRGNWSSSLCSEFRVVSCFVSSRRRGRCGSSRAERSLPSPKKLRCRSLERHVRLSGSLRHMWSHYISGRCVGCCCWWLACLRLLGVLFAAWQGFPHQQRAAGNCSMTRSAQLAQLPSPASTRSTRFNFRQPVTCHIPILKKLRRPTPTMVPDLPK